MSWATQTDICLRAGHSQRKPLTSGICFPQGPTESLFGDFLSTLKAMFIHFLNRQVIEMGSFYKWNEGDMKVLNWDLWNEGVIHSHKPNNVSVKIETKNKTSLSTVQIRNSTCQLKLYPWVQLH